MSEHNTQVNEGSTEGKLGSFKYLDHVIDVDVLPMVSVRSLVSKGLNHLLGNEVASEVTGWKEDQAVAGLVAQGREPGDFDGLKASQVFAIATSAGVMPTEQEIVEKRNWFIARKIEGLIAGKSLASAVRGPRGNPLETLMRQIAKTEVTGILLKVGKKFPNGKETLVMGTPDGPHSFTGKELVDRRIANPTEGPRIRKLAEKQLAEQAKVVGKVQVNEGDDSAEALGL